MTMIPWHGGRALVWDYTCVDTVAASNISATSVAASAAAEKAFRAKEAKYQELSSSYSFAPIAMETMGSWASGSLLVIREIGRRLSAQTGERRATAFLLQAISIAVQRANATSITGTIPPTKSLSELFYML